MTRFPWAEVMAAGLGTLRLSPAAFWAATPREIAAALPRRSAGSALPRTVLETLLDQFPDET